MNTHPGVIGRKLGMTQVFTSDGTVIPCTVVEARPVVVGKRTKEKDGYDAVVLGLAERKDKHTAKAQAGMYKNCLLYTSPSPRDRTRSRMPSSA